jgi:tetratricopeptide (TPR) repeat protein
MAINRDKILKGAEKLVQKGKIEPAIREYEKLLKLNPNDVNTINRIGDLNRRIGQLDRAVELYERIADSYAADGFTNKAIAIFKKINRLVPDRVEVFERLAELYIQQGLVVEAKDQYSILAEWFVKNDDFDNAVQVQRKLIQIDPENHIGHLRLADLLFRKGDAEEAIEVYQRLGTMLLNRGKLEEAERLYRHALDQDPPSGEFLLPICDALVSAGNLTVAREFLIEAQKRSPDSTLVGILDLKVALAAGETRIALDRAEALLKDHADDPEVACLAGRACLGAGETARGTGLLVPIANSRLDAGDRSGAEEIYKWLAKVVPADRDVLKLGIQALSPTEDQEMIFTLKAGLADSFFQAGESEEARRIYTDLIGEDSENTLFRDRLAGLGVDIAVKSAVPPQAEAPAPVVPDLEDESPEIEFEGVEDIEFPGADEEMGSVEVEPPGPASEVAGFDPDERLAEANVFAKYGLIDKALNHLEKILDFFPENDEAREKLVSLALEAERTDLAAREVGPLLEKYRSEGNQEALDKWEQILPGTVGSEAPESLAFEDGGAEEQLQVEIIEDDDIEPLEMDADLESFEIPAEDDFEAVAAPVEAVEGIEEIELEEVGLDSFQAREPEVVEDGIDFEPFGDVELSTEGDDVPDIEFPGFQGEVPSPEPASEAIDLLDNLEKELLGGGVPMAPTAAQEPGPSVEEAIIEEISDDAVEPVSGPLFDDLRQMDTFLENSLYEDATRLLRRMEAEYPSSSEVAERRMDLKAKGFLMEEVPQVAEESADLFVGEEEVYVDLAAELEMEMAAEEALVEKAAGPGDGEVDLEDVFREFQKGVAEQLSEEDADTHFNLGIAYKEMGLLPEAIREFQVASKDEQFFVECCSMIGVCYIEQGLWDQAASWYQRALEVPELASDVSLGLKYELANCLEGSGDYGGAAQFFEEIKLEQPAFRDVSSRVDALAGHLQAN